MLMTLRYMLELKWELHYDLCFGFVYDEWTCVIVNHENECVIVVCCCDYACEEYDDLRV
jgi:hypothetical protein